MKSAEPSPRRRSYLHWKAYRAKPCRRSRSYATKIRSNSRWSIVQLKDRGLFGLLFILNFGRESRRYMREKLKAFMCTITEERRCYGDMAPSRDGVVIGVSVGRPISIADIHGTNSWRQRRKRRRHQNKTPPKECQVMYARKVENKEHEQVWRWRLAPMGEPPGPWMTVTGNRG